MNCFSYEGRQFVRRPQKNSIHYHDCKIATNFEAINLGEHIVNL
jgi:hypothetical protein